jgi:predicted nucleic acid-binding protein
VAHCLDSWAILAWLDGDDPAAEIVDSLVRGERPLVSWVNLVEVEYRVWRDHGETAAKTTLGDVREVVQEDLPGIERMRYVAALKARLPIALADCFAIATAASADATLVTGDPEIIDRASELPCQVRDVR